MESAIFDIYEEIDKKIDIEVNDSKKELLKLMNWSISVIIVDSLKESTNEIFNLSTISLKEFEGRFKHYISISEWSEYKSKYKGFKKV